MPMEPKPLCLILASQAEHSPKALPLGAACAVSAIKADARLAALMDARVLCAEPEESAADFSRRVASQKPAYLGFSLFVWNRSFLTEAARDLRSLLPGVALFCGGPEVSAAPETFSRGDPFDFILSGEGESSLPLLFAELLPEGNAAGAKPFAEIPFHVRGPTVDAELLPSPWLDGSIAALERGGALWELTRGCPFACAYCYESKGEGKTRALPLKRLEKELELFSRSGVEQVSVLDPTFNADRSRVKALLDLIESKGEGIFFSFELRAEFIDREQARRFADFPCSLQIGLQSAHPAVMRALGRPFDPALFARKLRMLDEAGAVYGIDLMYGLPGDSHSGFLESVAFALSLRPNHLDIFRLAVLPGTALHEKAASLGLEFESSPPYTVKSAPGYPAEDIERSASFARAVEVFYNRGRAVPWFGSLATASGVSYGVLLAEIETALRLRKEARNLGDVDKDGVFDHRGIELFQLDFAKSYLQHRGRPECIDAVLDLIRLHGAYSRALAEGEESIVALSYDPDAMLSPAGLDPRAFARSAKRRPNRAWIGRDEDGDVDLRPLPTERPAALDARESGDRLKRGGPRDAPRKKPDRSH
jgi:radical SAM superfamily enzyme YgiQ (UPF0313 family)